MQGAAGIHSGLWLVGVVLQPRAGAQQAQGHAANQKAQSETDGCLLDMAAAVEEIGGGRQEAAVRRLGGHGPLRTALAGRLGM